MPSNSLAELGTDAATGTNIFTIRVTDDGSPPMSDSKSFVGINMKRLWDDRGTLAPWVEPLSALIDDGTIAPVVHAAIPFDRAGEAHRILAARENVGKVVLVP